MGEHFCNYITYGILLLCSDLNEDFAHCKYLHTVTVENLKDMKANEVGYLSRSTLYIRCIAGYMFRAASIFARSPL